MRIEIAMRTFEAKPRGDARSAECFAEFEVDEGEENATDDDDVQVTVVLRGKRGELEDSALGVTELVLRALEARDKPAGKADVIDVAGIALEPACATG